jgi:hypothetical protein
LHSYKQKLTFKKNGLTVKKIKKKIKKKRKPEYTKIEKKNQKKSSKEISVRDHSDYEKIPKKCTLLNVLLFITNFMEIVKSFKDKVLSTRNKQKPKKKILKTAKNPKKILLLQI